MNEMTIRLERNGAAAVPGGQLLLGYAGNRGVYRLRIDATGEWEGLAIRCFWHVPDGKDPASSLVVDGSVDVPASVTAQPGSGCVTFEGSDGTKTVTSADTRYRVSANSGTENGTEPEPGTPAWQQLVDAVHTDATAAEQAKSDAQTAASEAATSAGNADQSAQEAADSLRELKDGIASGDFKGEKGDKGDTGPAVALDPTLSVSGKAADAAKVGEAVNAERERAKAAENQLKEELSVNGIKGDKGDTGPRGEQGPKGDPGPAGADGKDAPQIDDTTVTDSAPWSSKHIVDVLCPPLEETGNPVQCYPVAEYPLGVNVSWEPTQEGSGEPSPENIRPIKGRDSVTVERCGENLLDSMPELPIRIYKDSPYIAVRGGTLPAGQYTMDVRLDVIPGGEALGAALIKYELADGTEKYFVTIASKETSATTAFETAIKAITVVNYGNIDGNITGISLVPGDGAGDFERYTGQTATLTLPETVYGGTVDAVTGEGQETWKFVSLDGTEEWGSLSTISPGKIRFTLQTHETATPTSSSIKGDIVCSQYTTVTANDTYHCKNGIAVEPANRRFIIIYNDTNAGDTIDEWKSYLAAQYAAGTPVQIAYKLATPTPFTATGAQPFPALSSVNTVLTDADSVTVTGRADPIKRIIDLEDAVASMTTT